MAMRAEASDGLILLEETDSTQDEVRRRLRAGAAPPLWVMARRQTAGRGRKGREWVSRTGNLHLSAGLRLAVPAASLPQLSFVAALAAHKAVCALAQRHGQPELKELLTLKWPNDLLLAGRKVGGLLLESEPWPAADGGDATDSASAPAAGAGGHAAPASGSAPAHMVIVGWGLNLVTAPPDAAVRWPALALLEAGLDVPPWEVAGLIRDYFERWLARWRESGFAPVRTAWEKRAWARGLPVTVAAGEDVHRGRLAGLAEDGALVLEKDGGERIVIHAGEILPEGTGV